MNIFDKNRNREKFSFANINLLGKCNVDCYFCLGKDIGELLSKHNQLNEYFINWKNFVPFLEKCKQENVNKLYITGQNTDALCYKYLYSLISYLKSSGFNVGIRTNGYNYDKHKAAINLCDLNVGYSIHTLNCSTNHTIMGRFDIPRWDKILTETENCRVSIVVNRHNIDEFTDLVEWVSQFPNVKYIQARRVSTDTRQEELKLDADLYEGLYENFIKRRFDKIRDFYGAEEYDMYGKPVCFWRTVKTSANSLNYFTDGTISDQYFIVEGYLQNYDSK